MKYSDVRQRRRKLYQSTNLHKNSLYFKAKLLQSLDRKYTLQKVYFAIVCDKSVTDNNTWQKVVFFLSRESCQRQQDLTECHFQDKAVIDNKTWQNVTFFQDKAVRDNKTS